MTDIYYPKLDLPLDSLVRLRRYIAIYEEGNFNWISAFANEIWKIEFKIEMPIQRDRMMSYGKKSFETKTKKK